MDMVLRKSPSTKMRKQLFDVKSLDGSLQGGRLI